jgi:hypothetical protein
MKDSSASEARDVNSGRRTRRAPPSGLASQISHAFLAREFDLSARGTVPAQGWEALPEVAAAEVLRHSGATPVDVRLFVTFCAAMDRARNPYHLWDRAVELFRTSRWCFLPGVVIKRPLRDLQDALQTNGVSQRHEIDSAGWWAIADSLAPACSPAVHSAVFAGSGVASELLDALTTTTAAGRPLFPLLRGPKIGPMWVRMLVLPGGARIEGFAPLPVAVDEHVRRATSCLGLADTNGMTPEESRTTIQEAWMADVHKHGAEGPGIFAGTCAALDPALRYFGTWGCGFCERLGRRVPIGSVCKYCRFGK